MRTIRLFIISIVTGVLFGLLCLWIERAFGHKVYTLLMNVDYMPILKNYTLPVVLEFSLHLIICVLLTFALAYCMRRYHWSAARIVVYSIGVNVLIAILLYPTTLLSERTPPLTSLPAFSWWLIAHSLYGALLGYCLVREKRRFT